MKTVCLMLSMIGSAMLVNETSYAFALSPASPEQSSLTSAKPPGSDHATDAAVLPGNRQRQKHGTRSDEQRTRRHISDKNHSHSRVNPTKANRPKQLRNSRERSTSQNVMNVHQPSSSKPTPGAARIANNRSLPVRSPNVVALNGQQFKNAHNRASSMTTIGGPANPVRNTAAIDGTGINRRHVN